MRVGLLGGTFDPPHVGHLLAAIDAYERLALDRLAFVPAATQPLKAGRPTAPASERLAMLRLLVGDDPRFSVDPVEIDREGLSYTVETLDAYARRHPGAELFFLAGADVLTSFARWREPARVLTLARLVLLMRAAADVPDAFPAVETESARLARAIGVASDRAPLVIETRRVDVSATEIRERVRMGKSIRGFVPDAVAAHIAAAGLYR